MRVLGARATAAVDAALHARALGAVAARQAAALVTHETVRASIGREALALDARTVMTCLGRAAVGVGRAREAEAAHAPEVTRALRARRALAHRTVPLGAHHSVAALAVVRARLAEPRDARTLGAVIRDRALGLDALRVAADRAVVALLVRSAPGGGPLGAAARERDQEEEGDRKPATHAPPAMQPSGHPETREDPARASRLARHTRGSRALRPAAGALHCAAQDARVSPRATARALRP